MLSKIHFVHNTILSLNNTLLLYKEYFSILTIGQGQTRLLNPCIRQRRPCDLLLVVPHALLSITNSNPFYQEQ